MFKQKLILNKLNFMTEVTYDIGKELVQRYNYLEYLNSKLQCDSFNIFKEKNKDKQLNWE